MEKDKILIIIAARGGSKGVKNKNIKNLCGLPLIACTIRQAKKWGRADKIICSTDSKNIAEVAKKFGVEVPFIRPKALATDRAGKIDVLRHALRMAEGIYKEKYDIVVDLDVTAPIRKISDIEGCYQIYLKKRPLTVFSVTASRKSPYFNMVKTDENGYAELVKTLQNPALRRQDVPKSYDMNASIYVYDRDYLLNPMSKTPISKRSLIFVMDELSAFDIDTETDFKFIEFLSAKRLVKL